MTSTLVVFTLDEMSFGLDVRAVQSVIWAAFITHLPNAPDIVLGAINVHGRVVPVVNTRQRLGLKDRGISASDQFIIVTSLQRHFALVVDSASNVIEIDIGEIVSLADVLPALSDVEGVAKLPSGLLFIHDVARFLSLDDEAALDKALPAATKTQ